MNLIHDHITKVTNEQHLSQLRDEAVAYRLTSAAASQRRGSHSVKTPLRMLSRR